MLGLLKTLFRKTTLAAGFRLGLFLLLPFLYRASAAVISTPEPKSWYLHQIYRSEDGLPNPYVRAITQSKTGYIWLSTDECLVRFDGMHFEEYDRKSVAGRVDRWCVGITEGRDGSVWVSSANRGLTRVKDGEITRFTTENGLLHNYVLSLYEDRKGVLWVGTSLGLCQYSDGKFISRTNDVGLPDAAVRCIYEAPQGDIWVGTSKGLSHYSNNQFTLYPSNQLAHEAVMCVFEDSRHTLWVGTAGGLTHIVNGKATHYTAKHGLLHNAVRAICEDQEGTIWIGTQGGLQRFVDGRLRSVTMKTSNDPEFEGISFVYSLYVDKDGDLWVGTNLGLSRLQRQKFQTVTTDEGLLHNSTTLVYQDRKGDMWIGTYGGGLSRLHGTSVETWTTANGLSDDHVLALCEDHEGTMWIGTDFGGLDRLKDGKFTNYRTHDLQANSIRLIYEDSKTNLWICSNAGVSRFIEHKFVQQTNLPRDTVKTIIEDKRGTLWFGGQSGLLNVGPNWMHSEKQRLSSAGVNTLYEDSGSLLWVGTDAGLNVILGTNIATCSVPSLVNQRFLQILEDNEHRLWFGTRDGVFCASRDALLKAAEGSTTNVPVVSFGKKDGMRRAQCNGIASPAGWKTRDGRVWFATLHGVVAFDPKQMHTLQAPPPVAIERVTVDGALLPLNGEPHARPGRGEAEFAFTALCFQNPEAVRFKYFLEGFDTQWRDSGGRRTARYTNLRPGNYRFRVKACNAGGVWNEAGATLAFTLRPHFYQTSLFYVVCVLGIGLAVTGVHFYRVLSLRQRERELVTLVEKRTAKLQEIIKTMESFNYSIAHDLRAPLRAIKGFTNALIEDYSAAFDGVAHDYSRRIQQAVDRMDKLIDDLLIFGRITHKEITVTWVDLDAVIERVQVELANDIALRKGKIRVERPLPKVWANETLLQQILTNLVSNSLKFVPAGTAPEIEIWTEKTGQGSTKLFVRDNGIGIDVKHHHKIFGVFERLHSTEAYPGTGIGLAIVQKATERMDGKVGLSSKLGVGSCFWIELFEPAKPSTKTLDKAALNAKVSTN